MKKLLSLILVTMLCVCALASCAVVDTVKGWLGIGEDPGEVIEYNLPGAVEYLRTMYINGETVTPNDYELVAQVMIKAVKYTVDWSVDNDKVKLTKGETSWTVDVDNFAEEAHDYTLTATITAGDGTKDSSLTFKRTVPKYEVLTYEEFLAAEDDTAVTVQGVITGIVETSKENDLYIQDEDGGYFIFAMEDLPSELGLQNGMTVSVTGIRDTYYDLPQVTEPKVTIVDSTIKTVEPVDITEYFAAAEANVDDHFAQYFSMLVTIKGAKVLGQDASDNSYYNFSLAGKQAYVRISSSTCMLSADAQATFQKNVADHVNYNADIVGLVSNFGGKMYLIPIDENAFSNFILPPKTDAEKVADELAGLKVGGYYKADAVVDLATVGATYGDAVSISWASDNAAIAIEGGKATITATEAYTAVKLTATATCGEATDSKEFTVVLSKAPLTVTQALAVADNNKIDVKGYVKSIDTAWSDEYGNITVTITDGISTLSLYRLATKVEVGNIIVVADGTIATKNGDRQINAGATATIQTVDQATCAHVWVDANCTTPKTCYECGLSEGTVSGHSINEETHTCTICGADDPDHYFEMTIVEALAAPKGKKVVLTGTVSEINSAWSEEHGNMEVYLADEEGNKILLFRITVKVEVDDVLVVTGVIGQYNNVNQIAQGSTVEVVCDHQWNNATCVLPKTCSVCGETEGEALGHAYGEDGVCANGCGIPQGHTHSYTAVTTEATCLVPGSIVYTCECTDTYTEVIPAGHKITDGVCTACNAKVVTPANAGDEADNTAVIITGMVAKIKSAWSTQYGNMDLYIVDEAGNGFYLYRLATQVELGDVITATGKIGSYNGAKQLAAGATAVISETAATDAYKASAEKYLLNIATSYAADATVALAATGSFGGAITWTVNGEAATELAIVVGNDAQSFALVATITVGESVLTKEFTVTVDSKAAIEKAALSITTSFTADGTLELPTAGATHTDVVISWADAEGNAVTGPVNITQTDDAQTINLVATIVSGNTTETKEFTVTVSAKPKEGEPQLLASFDFGENGSASHVDGSSLGTSKDYTSGAYTLSLTGLTNVYGPAYDATGNSCIKFGSSKNAGSATFTVADDVNSVKIYVAKYKTNASTITINGTVYTPDKNSNDGEYTEIVIDTSVTKTVVITTGTSGDKRIMVNTIEFWS